MGTQATSKDGRDQASDEDVETNEAIDALYTDQETKKPRKR